MSVQELIERLPGRSTGIDCTGLTGASAAYLVSRLRAELDMPIFLVTSSQKAIDSLAEDLRFFLAAVFGAGVDISGLQHFTVQVHRLPQRDGCQAGRDAVPSGGRRCSAVGHYVYRSPAAKSHSPP